MTAEPRKIHELVSSSLGQRVAWKLVGPAARVSVSGLFSADRRLLALTLAAATAPQHVQKRLLVVDQGIQFHSQFGTRRQWQRSSPGSKRLCPGNEIFFT